MHASVNFEINGLTNAELVSFLDTIYTVCTGLNEKVTEGKLYVFSDMEACLDYITNFINEIDPNSPFYDVVHRMISLMQSGTIETIDNESMIKLVHEFNLIHANLDGKAVVELPTCGAALMSMTNFLIPVNHAICGTEKSDSPKDSENVSNEEANQDTLVEAFDAPGIIPHSFKPLIMNAIEITLSSSTEEPINATLPVKRGNNRRRTRAQVTRAKKLRNLKMNLDNTSELSDEDKDVVSITNKLVETTNASVEAETLEESEVIEETEVVISASEEVIEEVIESDAESEEVFESVIASEDETDEFAVSEEEEESEPEEVIESEEEEIMESEEDYESETEYLSVHNESEVETEEDYDSDNEYIEDDDPRIDFGGVSLLETQFCLYGTINREEIKARRILWEQHPELKAAFMQKHHKFVAALDRRAANHQRKMQEQNVRDHEEKMKHERVEQDLIRADSEARRSAYEAYNKKDQKAYQAQLLKHAEKKRRAEEKARLEELQRIQRLAEETEANRLARRKNIENLKQALAEHPTGLGEHLDKSYAQYANISKDVDYLTTQPNHDFEIRVDTDECHIHSIVDNWKAATVTGATTPDVTLNSILGKLSQSERNFLGKMLDNHVDEQKHSEYRLLDACIARDVMNKIPKSQKSKIKTLNQANNVFLGQKIKDATNMVNGFVISMSDEFYKTIYAKLPWETLSEPNVGTVFLKHVIDTISRLNVKVTSYLVGEILHHNIVTPNQFFKLLNTPEYVQQIKTKYSKAAMDIVLWMHDNAPSMSASYRTQLFADFHSFFTEDESLEDALLIYNLHRNLLEPQEVFPNVLGYLSGVVQMLHDPAYGSYENDCNYFGNAIAQFGDKLVNLMTTYPNIELPADFHSDLMNIGSQHQYILDKYYSIKYNITNVCSNLTKYTKIHDYVVSRKGFVTGVYYTNPNMPIQSKDNIISNEIRGMVKEVTMDLSVLDNIIDLKPIQNVKHKHQAFSDTMVFDDPKDMVEGLVYSVKDIKHGTFKLSPKLIPASKTRKEMMDELNHHWKQCMEYTNTYDHVFVDLDEKPLPQPLVDILVHNLSIDQTINPYYIHYLILGNHLGELSGPVLEKYAKQLRITMCKVDSKTSESFYGLSEIPLSWLSSTRMNIPKTITVPDTPKILKPTKPLLAIEYFKDECPEPIVDTTPVEVIETIPDTTPEIPLSWLSSETDVWIESTVTDIMDDVLATVHEQTESKLLEEVVADVITDMLATIDETEVTTDEPIETCESIDLLTTAIAPETITIEEDTNIDAEIIEILEVFDNEDNDSIISEVLNTVIEVVLDKTSLPTPDVPVEIVAAEETLELTDSSDPIVSPETTESPDIIPNDSIDVTTNVKKVVAPEAEGRSTSSPDSGIVPEMSQDLKAVDALGVTRRKSNSAVAPSGLDIQTETKEQLRRKQLLIFEKNGKDAASNETINDNFTKAINDFRKTVVSPKQLVTLEMFRACHKQTMDSLQMYSDMFLALIEQDDFTSIHELDQLFACRRAMIEQANRCLQTFSDKIGPI